MLVGLEGRYVWCEGVGEDFFHVRATLGLQDLRYTINSYNVNMIETTL